MDKLTEIAQKYLVYKARNKEHNPLSPDNYTKHKWADLLDYIAEYEKKNPNKISENPKEDYDNMRAYFILENTKKQEKILTS